MRTTAQDLGAEVRQHIDLGAIALQGRKLSDEINETETHQVDRRQRLGKLLILAREAFGLRGDGFVEWVEQKMGFSHSTAHNYMRAAGYVPATQASIDPKIGSIPESEVKLRSRPLAKAPAIRVDRSVNQSTGDDGFGEAPEEQEWRAPGEDHSAGVGTMVEQPTFATPPPRPSADRKVELAEAREAAVRAVAVARAAVARWVEASTRDPAVPLDGPTREIVYRDTADMQDRIAG